MIVYVELGLFKNNLMYFKWKGKYVFHVGLLLKEPSELKKTLFSYRNLNKAVFYFPYN